MDQQSNQRQHGDRRRLNYSDWSRSSQNKHHELDDERGAGLVEFALISSMLVMLVLGTVTLGMSFHRSLTLNSSAHEAVRYGSTLPVEGNLNAWLNAVANVAIESAAGELGENAPGQHVCVAYVYPAGVGDHDRTASIIETEGTRVITAGTPCFDDSRPGTERRIQVQVGRETDVSTGVYTKKVTLNSVQVARFERAD